MGSTAIFLPDAQSASDEELALLGMKLWPHTFAKTDDVLVARRLFIGTLLKHGMPAHQIEMASIAGLTAAQWAHYGYPTLTSGHKFAAALMATRAQVESMEGIHVPWLAFRCLVPDGLLHLEGTPIDRIMISRRVMPAARYGGTGPGHAVYWVMEMYPHSNDAGRLHVSHPTLHGLLSETLDTSLSFDNDADVGVPSEAGRKRATERVLVLAQRYVLGLLVMMQEHPKFGGTSERPSGPTSKRREGPPTHRTFVVGHAIDIDCRPAIQQYVDGATRGRRGPPSVQGWVMGYWRWQAVGVGRLQRKDVWVQPHWRGPEGAPILVRPRRVGRDERPASGLEGSGEKEGACLIPRS